MKSTCTFLALASLAVTGCINRTVLHGNNTGGYEKNFGYTDTYDNTRQQRNTAHNYTRRGIVLWFVKPQRGGLVLVPVIRPKVSQISISTAVSELLSGPTPQEAGKGFTSEIPRGVLLLKVAEHDNTVDLNLSHRFASDGGMSSFTTRLAQLTKTVSGVAGRRKVYLDIEGKRLNETMGDGVEVRQPIN